MTIKRINLGNQVNDGLGDDLRTAFTKVNENFATLDATLTITASNIGSTGSGVFKQKTGNNLEFKNLVGGKGIAIDSGENSLTVRSTQPDALTKIIPDVGSPIVPDNTNLGQFNVTGNKNITVSTSGSTLNIDTKLDLNQILLNLDFGPLTDNFVNPTQLALAAANIDMGLLSTPGRLNLDLGSGL
jgi:hypothetical protein